MMQLKEMKTHEWLVSWSGGKDSTATILLMREYGVPIKKIIHVRMMWDETIPATLPVMTEFVDKAVEVFREWGYVVEIVPSIKTAKQLAEARYFKSKYPERNGKPYGITAFSRKACKFTDVKQATIKKSAEKGRWEMIGYAADEAKRLHNLGGRSQSIMVALGVTEKEAFDICRKYGLLSPLYDLGITRDGCFFCPNASRREREMLKATRPDLVALIY